MKQLKPILVALCLICMSSAYADRIDTFKIKHTVLKIKLQNLGSKSLKGLAELKIEWKQSASELRLDLKQLLIDSVIVNQEKLATQVVGESVKIKLKQASVKGDSSLFKIYYHGTPALDPGGWGGFYFNGNYAFNLGVGFSVNPHSFGRAWMPCVDEFTMKSSYEFFVETDTNYTAACNGRFLGCETTAQSKIWHYLEPVPMSAYLAAVSVSQYAIVEKQYKGLAADFPIQLFAPNADTAKVNASFLHLPNAINCFEQLFGQQPYSKVGYNFVPFTGGAMEHAGNITFPKSFASGALTYETMMAHELSHHWWGNQVTCSTQEDMWLNEGWASYCEHLFTEQVYGKQAYKQSILNNHLNVLRYAHINDANVFSLVNIPHAYTYGNHVYKKGADVIHSLRSIMGDTNFFGAAKAYQSQFALKNASTNDMQAIFEVFSPLKARQFFNQWIKTPGFPHIRIVHQTHSNTSGPHIQIVLQQRSRFNDICYTALPIEIFFYKNLREYEKRVVMIQNCQDTFEFDLPFKPVYVALDMDEKLSDAITDQSVSVVGNNSYDLPAALCKLYAHNIKDSARLRVEHHWVGPELYRTKAPYMSDYRYYTLDGIWSNEATDSLDLELTYDGRMGGANSNLGYLDHTLIKKTEDSLSVLYRAFPGDYWRVWPQFKIGSGSKNDKQGKLTIINAKKGDYVLAMYDVNLSASHFEQSPETFKMLPNPTQEAFKIEWPIAWNVFDKTVQIHNQKGQLVCTQQVVANSPNCTINTAQWSSGVYQVQIEFNGFKQAQSLIKAQ